MKFKKFLPSPVRYIDDLGSFGIALLEYFLHKLDSAIWLVQVLTIKQLELLVELKFQAAARLIWSRGRRGRQVRYILMGVFVWVVFLAGGIFQDRLVEEASSSTGTDFLVSDSILYETTQVATISGENSLLDEPIEHEVQPGDTIASLGKKYGISIESIKYANNLTGNNLTVGQVLQIPPVEGTLHTVKRGDTIATLARRYNVPEQSIVDFNYLDAPYTLAEGQILTIPDAQLPRQERYYAGSQSYDISAYGVIPYAGAGITGSGQFVWPFSGVISQGFSRYHPGIDIASNSGSILAADKGTVVRAGWWQGGYGNAVQIDHGNGYVSTYAHMSVISVSNGDQLEKGQKIGVVGSTGRSTGPHLHFTVQLNGRYLNPLSLLQ